MILNIDTTKPLTPFDATVLSTLLQFDGALGKRSTEHDLPTFGTEADAPELASEVEAAEPEPEVKPKRTRTRKAKAEPKPEVVEVVEVAEEFTEPLPDDEQADADESVDDTVAAQTPDDDAPTVDDAVAAATAAIEAGNTDRVREALAAVGAPKVGKLTADQVPAFLTALEG